MGERIPPRVEQGAKAPFLSLTQKGQSTSERLGVGFTDNGALSPKPGQGVSLALAVGGNSAGEENKSIWRLWTAIRTTLTLFRRQLAQRTLAGNRYFQTRRLAHGKLKGFSQAAHFRWSNATAGEDIQAHFLFKPCRPLRGRQSQEDSPAA